MTVVCEPMIKLLSLFEDLAKYSVGNLTFEFEARYMICLMLVFVVFSKD